MKKEETLNYAPKVLDFERFLTLYFNDFNQDKLDLQNNREETLKKQQEKEAKFNDYVYSLGLNELSHKQLKNFVHKQQEKVKFYRYQPNKPNNREVCEKMIDLFKTVNEGRESERGYGKQLRKLEEKLFFAENINMLGYIYNKLESIYNNIIVVPEEFISREPILKGDIVCLKDCDNVVRAYINPQRDTFQKNYFYNMAGENIFDIFYEDDYADEEIEDLRKLQRKKR